MNDSTRKSVMTLRIIWAAMLMGEIMFMFVALVLGPQMHSATDTHLLTLVCAAMLVLVPLAYVLRAGAYRSGRHENGRIAPGGYFTGNIIFWAMCEGVAFFGLVVTTLAGKAGAAFAIAVFAMAVQVINFPTGRSIDQV